MPLGRAPLDLEMLLLPLRHHGKTHARLIGSLAPSLIPSWFGLVPAESLSLNSLRILGEPRYPLARMTITPAGPIAGLAPRVTRHGHLTVYENPTL